MLDDTHSEAAEGWLKFKPPAASGDAARGMLMFVLIVATLYFGREVFIPITLALLLAFILAPLVSLLRRVRIGRVPAVFLGMLVAVSVILGLGAVIGAQISELSADIPQYVTTIQGKLGAVQHYITGQMTQIANHVGMRPPAITAQAGLPGAARSGGWSQQGAAPLELAQRYLTPMLSSIGTLFIVLIVAMFALLQQEDLRDRMIRLLGSNDMHRTTLAIDDGVRRLSRYFVTQLCINTMFGIAIGIGLLILGIPHPVLFAILSALLRFVPYVGSMISALLPLSLAFAIDPGWSLMISTGILYLLLEGLTGQFIEPLTYGHSTGLSPFAVVIAAFFWSWLWGPTGLILSTPLTLCLVVMGRHVKRLEFLDILLGDRPALTPVESFYQRLLAGDADEAQDQAELMLKEIKLEDYYDTIAVQGLQLAAQDARRGGLSEQRLQAARETIRSLIAGLNDAAPDVTPDHVTVLCVCGRGPLDEAAAQILIRLLQRQGIGARLVAYEDAGRDRIARLDVSGIRMACVACLDISGSPAHLRYLIRRLRQYLPGDVPIQIGMWENNDPAFRDPQARSHMGADAYYATTQEAVAFCREAQK